MMPMSQKYKVMSFQHVACLFQQPSTGGPAGFSFGSSQPAAPAPQPAAPAANTGGFNFAAASQPSNSGFNFAGQNQAPSGTFSFR